MPDAVLASVGLPTQRPDTDAEADAGSAADPVAKAKAARVAQAGLPVPAPSKIAALTLDAVESLQNREAPADSGPALRTETISGESADVLATRILKSVRSYREDLPGRSRAPSTEFAVAALESPDRSRRERDGGVTLSFGERSAAVDYSGGPQIEEGDGSPSLPFELLLDAEFTNMGVQVGAFLRLSTATRYINNAMLLAPEVLTRDKAAIVPTDTPDGRIFRARFGPFTDMDAATACGLLEGKGMDCYPIEERDWSGAIRP